MPEKYRSGQAHVSDVREPVLCSKVGKGMFGWEENCMLTLGNNFCPCDLSTLVDALATHKIMDTLLFFTMSCCQWSKHRLVEWIQIT